MKDAKLLTRPLYWLRGTKNYWDLELNEAVLKLHRLPQDSADNNNDVGDVVESLNVHRIASSLSMVLRSITIELDEHSAIGVNDFSTHLNDSSLVDFTKVEQDIDLSMEYLATSSSEPLVAEGLLKSRMVEGVSTLNVTLIRLDLDPLLEEMKTSDESNSTEVESEIDWAWMSMFDSANLDLKIAEVVWA